ncbi:C6 domain protein [Cooperia oncophora]
MYYTLSMDQFSSRYSGTYSEVSFCGLDTTKQPAAQPTATSPSQQTSTSMVPTTTTAPATVSLKTTTGPSTESSQPSTTAWEEMTTVTDLSDSTEPMGTMPTETMPPPAEETTARMETTAQTEEPIDDTTEMSDSTDSMSTMPAEPSTVIDDEPTTAQAAEETTEPVENPETTDMPEGTTDSGMSESVATRDMSEGTTSMPIIETTGFSDGMVETTEMETAESSMITDWEGETSAMMETTTGRTTCDDCPELNVYLYNENPYEDGASVLNRYTRSGCKYVQFFCRPYQMTDYRPVQTVFNNDVSNTELPPYVEMSCKNGQWWYENVAVTSLSCIYEPPPTTTTAMVNYLGTRRSKQTMYEVHSTSLRKTSEWYYRRRSLCRLSCGRVPFCGDLLSANKGKLKLHEQDYTMSLVISRRFVEIYENGVSVGITGPSLNRTFTCNDEAQWVQLDTPIVVDNVSCVMEKGALPSTLTTMFTTRGDGMLSTTPWDWSTTSEYGGEETETTTESSRTTPGEGMPSTTPWDWSTTSEYGGEETESTTGSSRSTIPVEEPSTTEMMTDNSEEYPESTTPVGTDMSTAPPFTPSIPVTPSVPVSETTTAIPQSTEPTTDMEITTDNWMTDTESTVAQSTVPIETTSNSGVMTTQQETTTESEMETETPLVEASTTISEFTEGSTGPSSMTTPMEPEVSTSRAATVENPVSTTTSGSSTGGNSVNPPIITPVVGESTTTTHYSPCYYGSYS